MGITARNSQKSVSVVHAALNRLHMNTADLIIWVKWIHSKWVICITWIDHAHLYLNSYLQAFASGRQFLHPAIIFESCRKIYKCFQIMHYLFQAQRLMRNGSRNLWAWAEKQCPEWSDYEQLNFCPNLKSMCRLEFVHTSQQLHILLRWTIPAIRAHTYIVLSFAFGVYSAKYGEQLLEKKDCSV